MTALIVIAALLGYLGLTLLAARWRYRAIRPYTEPIACTWSHHTQPRQHIESCYRRYGMVDSTGEAVVFALLTGLAWPFIGPAILVRWIVITGDRALPEELQAQIALLEAENERLKRQQEERRL